MSKYLTKEGLKKIKKELDYLKGTKRKEIAKRLRRAASFGDLSENFAYQQAKEDQMFLEKRILELEKIISEAKIVEKKQTNKVEVGSTVFLVSKGEEEKFQIVGTEEANPLKGKVSAQSPLGKAILGKKAGEKVKIDTPEGKKEYTIKKIE